MITREDLLAGILADPADDIRRLAYADCLEEDGEADRAEFIRMQIELSRMLKPGTTVCDTMLATCTDCDQLMVVCPYHLMTSKACNFLDGHNQLGLGIKTFRMGGMRLISTKSTGEELHFPFDRGFIHAIIGPLAALLEHGPAICREHPVESVEVTDAQVLDQGNYGVIVHRGAAGYDFQVRMLGKDESQARAGMNAAGLAELKIRAVYLPEEREAAINASRPRA